MKDLKHIAIVIMVGLALFAQLMSPTPVHADGGTPPPSETSTPEPTQATKGDTWSDTPAPTDSARNISYPTATEPAPSTVEPEETPLPPTQTPEATAEPTEPANATPEPVETATPEQTGSTILGKALQWLPDDTSAVVLNENGQPLPLASQAAADVLAQPDPIWCPAGQAPTPGQNGCTPSLIFSLPNFTLIDTMAELLTYYGAYINSQTVAGTIWITAGAVPDANPIAINGSTYTNWANYGLTLQGGWSGISGDPGIVANSVFSVPITIANWNNTVGIANITTGSLTVNNPNSVVILADVVTSNIDINNPKGRIDIYNSTGNLTVDSANINNNGLYSSGINISTLNGNVTINNSSFYGNGYDGVWMQNVGNVSINNSHFFQNSNNGLEIRNANNVVIDSSTFNNNVFHGIYVSSTTGNITLSNITSNSDPNTTYGDGAYLDNTAGTGSITLTGTNDFSNHSPWNSGMYILSNGTVSLSGITSNNNGNGLSIIQADNVTMTNGNFSDNYTAGAYLANVTGDIQLNGITANENRISVSGNRNVTLNDVTVTGNNIYASGNGEITLNNVIVNGALGFGLALLSSGGNIIIDNSTVSGTVSDANNPAALYPWGDGADIFPNGGNVTITNSQFNGNDFDGAYIVSPGNVLVQDSSFNENRVGGLDVLRPNQVEIKTTEFTANAPYYDLLVNCYASLLSLIFDDFVPAANRNDPPLGPILVDMLVDNTCNYGNSYSLSVRNRGGIVEPIPDRDRPEPRPGTSGELKKRVDDSGRNQILSESYIELYLCPDNKSVGHRVNLPNGDKVEIVCPVGGKASISRMDNTTLPRELPAGYTFASAFQVEISQRVRGGRADERAFIDVITEGGFIKASFVAPSIQSGSTYSILYWDKDQGDWIPLKDFMEGTNGLAQIFSLHPDNPEDPAKLILRGVEFVSWMDPKRVEVTTNFPGIFVLVQQ